MPWLITGAKLALHQPFSPEVLAAQLQDEHCAAAVVPAAILAPLQEAGLLGGAPQLRALLAVTRAYPPETSRHVERHNGIKGGYLLCLSSHVPTRCV